MRFPTRRHLVWAWPLWIACQDADTLHDLIIKRGSAILSPLSDGPFGRFFVAHDPDGYPITFHAARS